MRSDAIRLIELVEGLRGLVEVVVAGHVDEGVGGRVHAGPQSNHGCRFQQFERPARDELGVTGAESDDSDDGLHL